MEPRIQYCKTKDGVGIAFCVMGKGRPLVMVSGWPFSHLEAEWLIPTYRLWHEQLAEGTRLVRYDTRGSGLSERQVSDLSIDGRLLDLEAVIGHLGLDTLDLFAWGNAGQVAITYAVRQPGRVAHLILWDCFARPSAYYSLPEFKGLLALLQADWGTFTETVAHVFFGWSAGEPARQFARFLRECTTPEGARAAMAAAFASDVSPLLSQVSSPTMVINYHESAFPGIEIARSLAVAIPNASLKTLDGVWITTNDHVAASVRAIHGFVGVAGEEAASEAEPPEPGAFRTILFTDVEGSTELTQRLGDARAREVLREHERMVREALKAHGGSEVKTMGDGFMVSFSSATKALECAIAMQRAFDEWNQGVGAQGLAPLHVRIGLNAGEPIAEDDPDGRSDLFGTAVNEAARITATAKGDEILVSNVVRELAKGKGFLFADRGEANLKGFDEPVRLFEVRWREEGQ